MREFCAEILTSIVINAANTNTLFQKALWLFMIRKVPFGISPKIFCSPRSFDPDAPGNGQVTHLPPGPGHRIPHLAGLHLRLQGRFVIRLSLFVFRLGPSV